MSALEILLAVVVALGLVGILVPLLPGSLLVAGAVLVWALSEGSTTGWAVLVVAAMLIAAGAVVKYLVPGRRLQRTGVPNRSLFAGAVLGVVGFFVVPVVGLLIGFVLGVYLSEWQRLDHRRAWPATVAALQAIGLGILIELAFTTLAATVWAVAAVSTS
ncbi:DUF456 domain-containing protein [Marmoricola sp. RAF53]|uniref:DUF456 domain-containing protein n=1 Tax=Marmoricola sp. RAF53 TaxID=3233059 RepID=UPI003F97E138